VIAPAAFLDGDNGGNFVLMGSRAPIDAGAIESAVPFGEIVLVDGEAVAWAGTTEPLTDDFAPADQLLSRP
jgi:hypothetical protein